MANLAPGVKDMAIPTYVAHSLAEKLVARDGDPAAAEAWRNVEDAQYDHQKLKEALEAVAGEDESGEQAVEDALAGVANASAAVLVELVAAAYFNDVVKKVADQDGGKTKGGDASARALADRVISLAKKRDSAKNGDWLDAAKLTIKITAKASNAAEAVSHVRKALELIVKDRAEQATKKRKTEDPKPKSAKSAKADGEGKRPEMAPEPVKEPTKEPVKEPTKEPVKEPMRETVKEPMRETVKEPMRETEKEPMRETAKEPMREPVKEPATSPIQKHPEQNYTPPPQLAKEASKMPGGLTDDVFASWGIRSQPAAAAQPVTPVVEEAPKSVGWGNCEFLRNLGL